jgi:glutamate/tyrosine decarboxylase-like PLP-dependent enzyme
MNLDDLRQRSTPLGISSEQFRKLGYRLIDQIADHFETLGGRPLTSGKSPEAVRRVTGSEKSLPLTGTHPGPLLEEVTNLLLEHSLFNAHPRFWGYITSGPAPIGVLADLLASAVNPNVGAWKLAPAATEIESQTVRWIAEFIGYPTDCGGLLVSGGNMANFICFLAARRSKATWDIRHSGLAGHGSRRLLIYASTATHTWIQKAADLFGHGTSAIRWIETDHRQRMNLDALRRQVRADRDAGEQPFLVVGNAGTVGRGAVDPLADMATFCRDNHFWFHVDGAYGACAANAPGSPAELCALKDADSVSVDPHKWLYAPLEAGCALVRSPNQLREAFSYDPEYYHFQQETTNYFDFGMQNSRGFRALKVWTALRQAGRDGYLKMIGDDIRLAEKLYSLASAHPELEALSRELSIVTFRFLPTDLTEQVGNPETEKYLNRLNTDILADLETNGAAFVSNNVVENRFELRACIVNFRTSLSDIEALPEIIAGIGRRIDTQNRMKTDSTVV